MRTLRIVALSGVLAALLCLSTFGQQDVFTDDFNDGDALGWAAVSGGRGWHVQDGRYVFDGSGWGRYRAVANVYLVDGAISFKATPLEQGELGWGSFGVVVKYVDSAHYVIVRFGAYGGISVMQWKGAERTSDSIGSLKAELGREYEVRAQVQGDQLRTFLDGKELKAATIGLAGQPGRVGLYTETPTAFDDFRVEGIAPAPEARGDEITGTPRPQLEFAVFQPDPLLPGEALAVRGQLHLYIRNVGDGAVVLEGLTYDGQDAEKLVTDGRLAWYHQHPYRIEPGEVGRVSLRLQGISEEQAAALMDDPNAEWRVPIIIRQREAKPLECEATVAGRGEPLQINMLTFGPDLKTIYAYLQANWPEGAEYHLTTVQVNGRDVTATTEFAASTVSAAVVPLKISLGEPLTWGRYVTVTVATREGASCGHCLRAFPTEFPLQVYLFRQVREDSVLDIYQHGFTCIGARGDETLAQMKELGLEALVFGGTLAGVMRWDNPDLPRLVAFWLDEKDEHPVGETIAALDESHAYYRLEGKFIPPQMINLVNPWSGQGMNFMDILDIVCHAYGLAGAINGRDFPLLSTLPWRELRAGRRPFWPYFRGAEVAMAADPETKTLTGLAPATQRVIEPEQERMMTYGCLQLGAKGICHWAYGVQDGEKRIYYMDGPGLRLSMGAIPYPTSRTVLGHEVPEEICKALKATWDEIGRINAELRTIGPWVANSDVSPPIARVTRSQPAEAVNGGPAAQAAALVSGLDTIILIALNLNIDTEWSGKDPEGVRSYDPVDATVRLDLPPWIEPAEVFSVDYRGIETFNASREGNALIFDLPGLEIQKIIVVTSDPTVREQMQARLAEMQERLRAMEAHVPVPKADRQ